MNVKVTKNFRCYHDGFTESRYVEGVEYDLDADKISLLERAGVLASEKETKPAPKTGVKRKRAK